MLAYNILTLLPQMIVLRAQRAIKCGESACEIFLEHQAAYKLHTSCRHFLGSGEELSRYPLQWPKGTIIIVPNFLQALVIVLNGWLSLV